MDEKRPIYRFTLKQEKPGEFSFQKEEIKDYFEIQWGYKTIYRYRDERSHCLRDVKPDKMDTLIGNVLYSYDPDMDRALRLMMDKISDDVQELEKELNKKQLLFKGLKDLSIKCHS
jgi:hypothetical protein